MTWAAVAWDIDGTLVDSEPLHLAVLQKVCGQHGVDIADIPDDRFRGMHMFDVWTALASRFPSTLTRETWLARITEAYVARSTELEPIADAQNVVAGLSALGIRQVCVSNSSRRIVDANIAALGIARRIELSISLDDVVAGKPDPEPYRAACHSLNIAPYDVVAVEDSETGALSARRAGLFVVGFSPQQQRFEDADVVVPSLRDVAVLLSGGTQRRPQVVVGREAPAGLRSSEA